MERRLAAILAIDVVGYTRLMGRDEEATLANLHKSRELINRLVGARDGRTFGVAGDSVIAEFASPVEAVRCAIEIQRDMAEINKDLSADNQMQLRIGVNLGDAIVDEDALFGEGVNIASRLEQLAEPGGIVLSRSVRDQIRDRLELNLADLGEIKVKNVARPVHSFQVLRDGETPQSVSKPQRRRVLNYVAMFVLVVSGASYFWHLQRHDFTPVDPASMALTLPEKPSIAVLPFENRAADQSKDWIGDGLTESIISTLALSPDMVVIARSTAFSYKGRAVTTQDVSRELGVRYVLSGSVQSDGNRLRVTAELADAVAGKQMWSMRLDRSLDDVFDVQDEIAEKIFEEMEVSLTLGEMARVWRNRAGDFETFSLLVRGNGEFQKFSIEGHLAAEKLWRSILETHPELAVSHYLVGWIHWQRIVLGISKDPGADMAEAMRLSDRALAIGESGEGFTLAAILALYSGRHDQAIAYADRALELAPGSAESHSVGGMAKASSGQAEEGLALMLRSMRLEPVYHEWLPGQVIWAYLELGQLEEAKALARAVLVADVKDVRAKPTAQMGLIAAAAFAGNTQEAQDAAQAQLDVWPQTNISVLRSDFGHYKNQEFVEKYLDALRAAGIPET